MKMSKQLYNRADNITITIDGDEYNIKNRYGNIDDMKELEKKYGKGTITLGQKEWNQLHADEGAYQGSLKRFRGYCHETNTEPTYENFQKFHTDGAEDEYLRQCAKSTYVPEVNNDSEVDSDQVDIPF